MRTLFQLIETWFPVFIPLFLAILSILAGIVNGRISLDVRSLVRVHSDLVLGLFSFIIWAFVAFQQTNKIKLNPNYEISLSDILILLFINFTALIVGLILLKLELPNVEEKLRRRWDLMSNGAFLVIMFFLMFTPIALAKPVEKPDVNLPTFRVIIPYFDESIPKQVGATKWGGRFMCDIQDIHAESASAAANKAISMFESSPRNIQLFARKDTSNPVLISRERVVVQERSP